MKKVKIVTLLKKLKEAMRKDRARIQIGEISSFGLELSRQRLRPSVIENSSEVCPQCGGSGRIQSVELSAIQILRSIEEKETLMISWASRFQLIGSYLHFK